MNSEPVNSATVKAPTVKAPTAKTRRGAPRWLRILGIALAAYLTRVIVDPVRKGRLRDVGWPRGLRPIVVVGLVAYAVGVLLIVLAPALRATLPLVATTSRDGLILPAPLVAPVFALTALALTLGFSGALHARAWLRWLVTGFVALVVLFVSVSTSAAPHLRVVALIAAVGLVVLAALRGPRRFAWPEFVIASALIWGSFITSVAGFAAVARPYGVEFTPILLGLVLATIGQLAIPSALAAGASLAKFAVSSAVWAARTVRDRIGGRAVLVALVVVVVWRLVDLGFVVAGFATDGGSRLLRLAGAAVLLGLIAAAWVGLRLLRRAAGIPSAPVLLDRIDMVAIAVAALTSVAILTSLSLVVGQVLLGFGVPGVVPVVAAFTAVTGSSTAIAAARGVGGLALLVLAGVQARRGRRTLPELYAAIGLAMLLLAATWLADYRLVWDGPSLALLGTVLSLVALAVALVRRRLDAGVAVSSLVALLIATLFTGRELLANPISLVLGFSALAVVLFGFVWSFLTGYGDANADSPRYPRPARVQLVLANSLFGLTVLAFSALARDPDAAIDLAGYAGYGASAFGDPLLAAGLLIAIVSVLTGREFEMDAVAQNTGTSAGSAGAAAKATPMALRSEPASPSTTEV